MSLRWLPNALSVARLILIVPMLLLLFAEQYLLTLILFAIAGISDGVDGWLAKRFGWQTRLGAVLDAAADKLMIAAVFIALGWKGLVPVWLVVLIFVRDLWIVLGAWYNRHHLADFEVRPFLTSKINTAVQVCFVLLVIADAAWPFLTPALKSGAVAVAALSVVVSGLDYLQDWMRQMKKARQGEA
ncbi:CDP-alcohol phosphatidyltransferase family protein [Natronospira bacteriovora]|uniref:CDP-diacylglycerol--glycerol-3-phosphate 3-phosphatidyltransferase n=1 Tax=Natronospira bacteriovora TaxID=3069753 RepID=A0ABU0W5Z4_9GAMM|nr:CDP-alcohol phosphatidyltransferase family protein [Natronospira sp. AB-CW4]MDQ2069447.1 CDP-alcohol phosphatidyltransferase family protein [Natronospira sp. AB-CW4]